MTQKVIIKHGAKYVTSIKPHGTSYTLFWSENIPFVKERAWVFGSEDYNKIISRLDAIDVKYEVINVK